MDTTITDTGIKMSRQGINRIVRFIDANQRVSKAGKVQMIIFSCRISFVLVWFQNLST